MNASLEKEPSSETGVWTAVTSLTKQRVRLNMKILGQFGSQSTIGNTSPQIKEDRPTYREQFIPPEMSMVSYFLNKVSMEGILASLRVAWVKNGTVICFFFFFFFLLLCGVAYGDSRYTGVRLRFGG